MVRLTGAEGLSDEEKFQIVMQATGLDPVRARLMLDRQSAPYDVTDQGIPKHGRSMFGAHHFTYTPLVQSIRLDPPSPRWSAMKRIPQGALRIYNLAGDTVAPLNNIFAAHAG